MMSLFGSCPEPFQGNFSMTCGDATIAGMPRECYRKHFMHMRRKKLI